MYQTAPVTATHQSQVHVGQHIPQVSTYQLTIGNPPTSGSTAMPNIQQEDNLKAKQRMDMHEILPPKAYVHETLGGLKDLPLGFVVPKFRNKFNGKSDPDTHVNAYLLSVRALQDRPNQLKAIFSQTLTGEALNLHRRTMFAVPHITPNKIFNVFISYYCRSTSRPLSLGELSSTKQNPGESFDDFIGRFPEATMRVIECPLIDPVKIAIVLENAALEYMTFFSQGLIPHSFDSMIERVARHERAKGTLLNTKPNDKPITAPQNKNKNKGNASGHVNEIVVNRSAQGLAAQRNNHNQNRRGQPRANTQNNNQRPIRKSVGITLD
ncbi:hypothetical protein AMTRI_Chr08g164970 [Amborella trichopoda]